MDRNEYERRVVEELHQLLFSPDGRTRVHTAGYLGNRVEVEEVRLSASPDGEESAVVVLYRDMWHPESRCLFGWRMPAAAPEEDNAALLNSEDAPSSWAEVVWANFMEHIEASPAGLPEDCSPDGINWTI
jgi:hypothetical protein